MSTIKAYGGSSPYIFVSYARAEKDDVLPVITYLQRRGYNVWFDEGIHPGSDWTQTLGARIEESACFLGFISRRSLRSTECVKEIGHALDCGKSMVNVFLEPVDPDRDAVADMSNTPYDAHEVAERLFQIQGIERFNLESDSDFYVKLVEHGLFDVCCDTEEFQVIDGNLVRYNGDATAVTVPDSVMQIGYNAFEGAAALQWLFIPAGVDRIGKLAFNDTPALHEFQVSSENEFFRSIDGVLFNHASNYLLCYPSARHGERYVVPEGVKFVAMVAFAKADVLASVTLPDSVTYIGDRAFEACRNLVSVHLGTSVDRVRPYTFSRCASLVACALPDGIRSLGDGAFSGCFSLESIELPAGLRELGEMTFAHCGSLKSVSVPGSVRIIPEYCFHECTSLQRADLRNVHEIAGYAFKNCESLADVLFGDNVENIGRAAFSGCASLRELRVPDSVKYVGDYSFDRCPNLRTVVFGEGVERIGEGAFKDDTELRRVEIPSSVAFVHDRAFPPETEVVWR